VLKGGTLIDGTGAAPVRNATLEFENGKITAVGRTGEFGERAAQAPTVIDVTGKTILPGFVNCHEHLDLHYSFGSWEHRSSQSSYYWTSRAARNALIALSEGVTTIRDVGSMGGSNIEVKRAIDDGMLHGPRSLASGLAICTTGGHGVEISIQVDGVDAVRRATRQILRSGADLIKIMASGGFIVSHGDDPMAPQFTVEELRAAVDEAHSAGRPTTAHCHPPLGIQRAVEAGVDCIEHGALLDQPSAELMAKNGTYLVPTIGETIVLAERGETLGKPDWLIAKCKAESASRMESFRFAVDAGVKIAGGTDTCDSMADEVELMIRGGMSPMQAIVAATRTGAELAGLGAQTGTLASGKWADIIVVEGDPIADVKALSRIELVFKEGALYRPAELRPAIGRYPL
jgi:imidazolonepropionase-like amidohydrolase